MTLLFLTTIWRNGDPTGTVTGRSQVTKNARRSAKRSPTRVSTIDLYAMTNSAGIWLKLVEPKIFVAKWMILRTKITPTIWLHKKLTLTDVIGGFVRTRLVPIPCQSGTDLTSNKHCQLCGTWRKKKKFNKGNDGHKVILRLGGAGKEHAAGGGSKRRYQYCSDNSGTIIYLRALQGHAGSNLIDPTLQDNVLIGTGIFLYIYHVGCAFNLHSIINNG